MTEYTLKNVDDMNGKNPNCLQKSHFLQTNTE